MLMKSKTNKLFFIIFILFLLITKLFADEFDISATSIKLTQGDKEILAEGNVIAEGKDGLIIEAEKILYNKEENILDAENSVKVLNTISGNQVISEKIQYFKNEEKIISKGLTHIELKNDYNLVTKDIIFNRKEQIIKSENLTKIEDNLGNSILLEVFNYSTKNKHLRSKGNIEITDDSENKYFFDDVFIDIGNNQMAGSNIKIKFNKNLFGNTENDPRLVANSAIITENKSIIEKGVFTSCKKNGEKCPPWKISAKTIIHDKEKKIISYKNAKLHFYGFPVFYFPKFFHPDPTVKRQSGFLAPSINDSSTVGTGLNLPYYFALAEHKDLTIDPKIYINENPVLQTEYRHVTKNSYSIIDTSFNEGYKKTTTKKTGGTRNHFFAKSDIDLDFENFDESSLKLNLQTVSNDTYLRIHNISSDLIDNNTIMKSSAELNLTKDDSIFDLDMYVYENLNKTDNRYEYIIPSYTYKNKLLDLDKFGEFNFVSSGSYKQFETNKDEAKLINDINWNSNENISGKGILTKFEGNLKNSNYKAENSSDLKNESDNYEIASSIALISSLPLQKISGNIKKTLTPKLMFRTAPFHMRNVSNSALKLDTSNLFTLNKMTDADVVEEGTSITLGTNYTYWNKKNNFDTLNLSLGQVYNFEENTDMPTKSSLDQKTSELVGEIDYKLSENNEINYKFSLDHNYNDLNYNEISGIFSISKFVTDFEYVEENNFIGNNHYINTSLAFELNKYNSLNFSTRKNFVTDMTEFYKYSYQYENDCLRAAIEYNRKFYSDRDLEPSDDIMITLTVIPFGKISSPSIGGN